MLREITAEYAAMRNDVLAALESALAVALKTKPDAPERAWVVDSMAAADRLSAMLDAIEGVAPDSKTNDRRVDILLVGEARARRAQLHECMLRSPSADIADV